MDPDWLPNESLVYTSAQGSVTMEPMPYLVQHFDKFVPVLVLREKPIQQIDKFVPVLVLREKPVLLLIDGNSARREENWITNCRQSKFCVVQLPANTSHFLQPCNESNNRIFETTTRAIGNISARTGLYSNAVSAFKI